MRVAAAIVRNFVTDKEEEELVLDDGAAQGTTPLVIPQAGFCLAGRTKIRPGVQNVVLPILVRGTVKAVAAALADLVEDRAANAVLRGERRSCDLDFRNALEDGVVNVAADGQYDGRAIGEEVGVIGEIAVDGNGVARVVGTTAFRGRLRGRARCSGKKDIKVGPIVAG